MHTEHKILKVRLQPPTLAVVAFKRQSLIMIHRLMLLLKQRGRRRHVGVVFVDTLDAVRRRFVLSLAAEPPWSLRIAYPPFPGQIQLLFLTEAV